MKKSLWIAAVAMAMGFGISSQAATNSVTGSWTFEGIATGALPSADPYNTWTSNGVAYVQSGGASGSQSLYFEGVVSNQFSPSGLQSKWYKTDFFMKPTRLEDLTLLDSVDSTARMAFYFDVNSNFNLLHGRDGGFWTTSKWTGVSYNTNSWVRVAIEQDCAASLGGSGYSAFTVTINGTNLTSALAYTRTSTNNNGFTGPASGGRWFMVRSSTGGAGMTALVAMGAGSLDEVNNTETMSLPVSASSINTAYGTITPVGGAVITNTLGTTFTAAIVDGALAYVSGLNVGSTTLSDVTTNTATKDWTLTYPMIHVYGSDIIALFEAKPDTSAQWLTNNFSVGPSGDYPTFAAAESDDADHDGFDNRTEAILGTDPTNSSSGLKITNIAVNAQGEIVVSFPGSGSGAAGTYKLYQSDDPNGPWTDVVNETGKGAGNKTITAPSVNSKKFYRIEMPYSGN
jgi:hypothetical protein